MEQSVPLDVDEREKLDSILNRARKIRLNYYIIITTGNYDISFLLYLVLFGLFRPLLISLCHSRTPEARRQTGDIGTPGAG